MALKEFDKEIEGVKFKTIKHPTTTGITLTTRILKFIAPAIGKMEIKGQALDSFAIELGSIFMQLGFDEANTLFKDLLSRTFADGKIIDTLQYDEIFAGEYEMLYKVVIWVIESNNFFGKGSIGDLLNMIKKTSTPVLPKD